jgi:hypothetical protein
LCVGGYAGTHCETALPCTGGANGQACAHSGLATGTGATCACDCTNTGYEGDNCESAAACTAASNGQACQNGGTTTGLTADNSAEHCKCSCAPGYGGANCETALACLGDANGLPCLSALSRGG